MKTFRRILTLCLAALMLLTLAACKNKDADADDRSAKEIVASAPLCLQILTDAEISLGLDESGNALAIAGINTNGVDAAALCEDVAGKTGAEAVKNVLSVIVENDYLIGKPYVVIRQEPGTILPNEDYLNTIAAAAAEVMGSVPVITVAAADMDADGYFNEEIAKQILLAYVGEDAKILETSVMIDGCFIISCEQDGVITDYSVGAYYGGVAPYSELQGDALLEEEEQVPENQQFGLTDDPEGVVDEQDQSAEDVTTVPDENPA